MPTSIHIEDIFGTRGRVSVLRCLAGVDVPLSIRQVARQAGVSHVAAAAILDDLVDMGLVAAAQAGRSRVHWLERRSLLVKRIVLPALDAEATIPELVLGALGAVIPDTVVSAVLFGSHARGEQAPHSDIDVLVVCDTEEDVAEALGCIDAVSRELRASLGATVSALGYTLEAAVRLQATGDNLMDGVTRDGVVIRGMSPLEWSLRVEAEANRGSQSQRGEHVSCEG